MRDSFIQRSFLSKEVLSGVLVQLVRLMSFRSDGFAHTVCIHVLMRIILLIMSFNIIYSRLWRCFRQDTAASNNNILSTSSLQWLLHQVFFPADFVVPCPYTAPGTGLISLRQTQRKLRA